MKLTKVNIRAELKEINKEILEVGQKEQEAWRKMRGRNVSLPFFLHAAGQSWVYGQRLTSLRQREIYLRKMVDRNV